ncbi:MAG: TlpA disulfide reductase family protein [bacterium]|nr:TlpA disulfide reductase family protein [bacterium]MDT8365990.1 TlpA disulfide reductase family protein [bacterium]
MYKKFLMYSFLAVICLLPLHAEGQNATSEPSSKLLSTGTATPVFSLPDILGQQVDVEQYLGKSPIVLSFWSIYCDSCVDEMLSLQKLEDKYEGEGLIIMAVNEDIQVPMDRIRRFIERLEKFRGKITYPLLYDEDSRVFNIFGVSTLPTLILIDKKGRINEYSHGFDSDGEQELLARVETLVKGEDVQTTTVAGQPKVRSEFITVQGEAALCGFFDSSGWRKSFSGSDSLQQELERTRDLARRTATRQTATESLRMLGIKLHSQDPMKGCISPNGIHLSRDPFDTKDPTSNLLNLLNYSEFFETIEEQEMLIDKTYYTTRQVRVSIDNLSSALESFGFLFEPLKITFTYVNMSRLDQKEFLGSLLNSSKYIGRFENPVFTSTSTSQIFEVYTSSQGFADEILGIDFGSLKVFVEEVTPTSLELEVWK